MPGPEELGILQVHEASKMKSCARSGARSSYYFSLFQKTVHTHVNYAHACIHVYFIYFLCLVKGIITLFVLGLVEVLTAGPEEVYSFL